MRPALPITRELVLVGGGHSHLGVLRSFARRPGPGDVRVTLVAREAEPLYSGMLPGLIAGRFTAAACTIDLARLAMAAGARFIRAEACGLARDRSELLLRGRPPLHFDLLSFNTGAAPALAPGAAEHALPLRPFDRFLPAWRELLRRADAAYSRALTVAVVGGGAAGVEVALALRRRLGDRARVVLVARGDEVLSRFAPSARRLARRALAMGRVLVHSSFTVARVEPGILLRGPDGRTVGCDVAIWAAGAAPPDWLRGTGLVLCPHGYLAVDAALRSLGEPRVFAAGDVASVMPHPRERAGVFAVRQGPPLAENLRRTLASRPLRPFRPQRRYLALLATSENDAIAVRGGLALRGPWALRLKDRIDRRWVRTHTEMPARPPAARAPAVEAPTRCGGCGAKLPAAVLGRVLLRLALGPALGDDAAPLPAPRPGHELVQTVDFFRAALADPYLLGRVAANHALGDIAAMGAEPRSALAIICLPPAGEAALEAEMFALLQGGREVLEAAGARLVGGHSAEGAEIALGFSVVGEAPRGRALRRSGLRPGDRLILTKPLGTGAVLAAAMAGRARAAWVDAAIAAMQVSPFPAARILRAHDATACADVTGFGLLNHLFEMLMASRAAAVLDPCAVAALPGAEEALGAGVRSTLHPANAAAAVPALAGSGGTSPDRLALLLDPQTAGGLLAGVPATAARACLAALRAAGTPAAVIGEVESGPPAIRLEPGRLGTVDEVIPSLSEAS